MKYLLSDPVNIAYLSGYLSGGEGVEVLLALSDDLAKAQLFVPEMFAQMPLLPLGKSSSIQLKKVIVPAGERFSQRVGAELKGEELIICKQGALIEDWEMLSENLQRHGVAVLTDRRDDDSALAEQLQTWRLHKFGNELELMRMAADAACRGFHAWLPQLQPGMSEVEAARLLDLECAHAAVQLVRALGGALGNLPIQQAFPTIVAFGQNSALPHHQPGLRRLGKDDQILVDWGVKIAGYHSDFSRSFCFSNADSRYRELWQCIEEARLAAAAQLPLHAQQQVPSLELVNAAQAVMGALYQQMPHTLGHGVGLKVHEAPSLSPHNQVTLSSSTAVTIEPGYYEAGWGGIRQENTYLGATTMPSPVSGPERAFLLQRAESF